MPEPRPGRRERRATLVLNRSCADLQGAIAELFSGREEVEVVVDRREGDRAMPGMPSPRAPTRRRWGWRVGLRSVDAELPEQAA